MIGAGVNKRDVRKVKLIKAGAAGDKTMDAGSEWTEERAKELGKKFEGGAVGSFRLNVPVS